MNLDAYTIGVNRTDKEMENTTCGCRETGNPDEYGEGSSLPCMDYMNGLFGNPEITCRNCIFCVPIKQD